MGFFGALAFGPTTFWLPSLFWLRLMRPERNDPHLYASIGCIVIGAGITVLGAVGSLRGIWVSARSFEKFFP